MKYLFLLSLLLFGCTDDYRQIHEIDLSFQAGDSVTIYKGTYKGCKGYISGFSNHVKVRSPTVYYSISGVTCQGKKIGNLSGAEANELKLTGK